MCEGFVLHFALELYKSTVEHVFYDTSKLYTHPVLLHRFLRSAQQHRGLFLRKKSFVFTAMLAGVFQTYSVEIMKCKKKMGVLISQKIA